MRLLTLKSIGNIVFISFIFIGCADINVAKEAYKNGDYSLAQKNYEELSERGFPIAYKGLGDINLQKQNEQLSLEYYTKAYRHGCKSVAEDIARVKLQHASTQQEYEDVYKWFLKAKKEDVEQNYIEFELARMKLEGMGIEQDIDTALKELKKIVQREYLPSVLYLANLYNEGKYVLLSYAKAIEYYTKAYNLGSENAKIKIADIYANKQSSFYDKNKAKEIYTEYSELGNGYASYQIAKLYKNDFKKALPWYKKSAKEGYLHGILKVELFRFEGIYLKGDKKTALERIQKLSQDGFSNASVALGKIYHSGIYLKKDDTKALYYFQMAYTQGDKRAKLLMAEIYAQKNSPLRDDLKVKTILENDDSIEAKDILAEFYEQRGKIQKARELYEFCVKYDYILSIFSLAKIKRDMKTINKLSKDGYAKATICLADKARDAGEFEKAIKFYKKAYIQGSKNALLKVADIYAYSIFQNKEEARKIYKTYADVGYIAGMYKFAKFMESTEGIDEKVFALYKKAAEMLYPAAKLKLADMYRDGIYVKEDINKAIRYYEELKEYPEAKRRLGDLYFDANGVKFDPKKALAYYGEAYKLGDLDAEVKIASVLYNGYGVDRDINKAKNIYEKHAKNKNYKAAYTLACIYEEEQNKDKALYWYNYASKNGYIDAKYKLALLIQKSDPSTANDLLKEAALGNCSKAQLEYGKNLFYGYGIKKNQFEGLKILYLALFNKEVEAIDIIMKMVDDIENLNDVTLAYKAAKLGL